jgi:hypothetical protein
MSRYPDPSQRTAMDPRVRTRLVLTLLAVALLLLQLSSLAPLSQSSNGYVLGVALGLAISTLIARYVSGR